MPTAISTFSLRHPVFISSFNALEGLFQKPQKKYYLFLALSSLWFTDPLASGLVEAFEESGCHFNFSQADKKTKIGPLHVHPENPRYFTDGSGRAVYLTGSHTWPSLVNMGPDNPPRGFNFNAFLNFLEHYGHNFVRMWTWELISWDTRGNRSEIRKDHIHHVAPLPWARTGPGLALDGKPKFNLNVFNDDYFARLRHRAKQADKRGIYFSIMLFEGWGVQFAPDAYQGHPLNPANNTDGLGGDANGDGMGIEIHSMENPRITAVQERYVKRVIDSVNDLNNILYEIANEAHASSTQWQYHMINLVNDYQASKPHQHPVGMTYQNKGGDNERLFNSPAQWISPNRGLSDSRSDVRRIDYRNNPPRARGHKVIITDTDHLWGVGGNEAWVWKSFLRGLNPIFMDPYDGKVLGNAFDPQFDPIRKSMGHTLALAKRIDLAAMTPQDHLASTQYCLAKVSRTNAEYLVYLPNGGDVTVDLSGAAGQLEVEWYNPSTGRKMVTSKVYGEAKRTLIAPFPGHAVVHIKHPKICPTT